MLCERVVGRTLEEIRRLGREDVLEMLGIELGPVRLKCALLSLKTLKAVLGDVPLAEVGGERVHALVQHVCARPKRPDGGPIAVLTVVTFVQHFRQFFAPLGHAEHYS